MRVPLLDPTLNLSYRVFELLHLLFHAVGFTFGFLLLAFTGIPLTSGFTAKFAAFAPAVQSGTMGVVLVVIGVLASAVTAFVYVRVIVLMYFAEPTSDDIGAVEASPLTTAAIAVGAVATLVLGVVPGPVLELAARASELIR